MKTSNPSISHKAQPGETRSAWIEAVRPRTLPLAASGLFAAAGLAAARGHFRWQTLVLMLVVSILLQVIANFADDLGDLSHGLDDATRVGPRRGMQRGIITPAQMKRALIGLSAITFILGCALVCTALCHGNPPRCGVVTAIAAFIALGVAAIAAAILYTVGPHPYGYAGLGDAVSFLFFGIVAVCGGTFLYTHAFDPAALVAGIALGLLVAAVMNINNMRDSLDDAAKGKRTVAAALYGLGERVHGISGETAMRIYHAILICGSLVLFLAALFMARGVSLGTLVRAAALSVGFQPLLSTLVDVIHEPDHAVLDRFMAPTSLGTAIATLVFALCAALG